MSRVLGLAALVLASSPLAAEPLRILHAEQIDLSIPDPGSSAPGASKVNLNAPVSFHAYGREFELHVEQNTSLTQSLAPELLHGNLAYRGRIAGAEDSWVRVTSVNGELYGAMWDGADLYSIAPGRELARHMASPLPDAVSNKTFVYRFTDTEGGVESGYCGADESMGRGAVLDQFRSLVRELKSLPVFESHQSGLEQIEVALVADGAFAGGYDDQSQGQMLAQANVADGIFQTQLGVAIVATDLIVFTDGSDPFTSSEPVTLLNQLSAYRDATPVVRERGLAHLFTGKDLEGSIAGIAYLDALCHPQRGVALTQGTFGPTISGLVMAHELGHNFGSPHDGERLSACAGAPPGFLMAPSLNGSDTFSACSIQQMQPRIQAAACVAPLRVADLRLDVAPNLQVYAGEPFDLPIDIRSIGELPSEAVRVEVSLFNIQILSAQIEGGTCSPSSFPQTCTLDSLAPGEVRRMTVRAVTSMPLNRFGDITAYARRDHHFDDNQRRIDIEVRNPSDITISSSPANISGLVGDPIDFSVHLNSSGDRSANNVRARLVLDALDVLSASTVGGSCTQEDNVVTCTYAEIPSGQARRVDVRSRAAAVNSQSVSVNVETDNDFYDNNNSYGFRVTINPRQDLALAAPPSPPVAAVGESFDITLLLQSRGIEATAPSTITLAAPIEGTLVLESAVVQGGSCTLAAETATCNVGAIEAGGARSITLRARGVATGEHTILATLTAPSDDDVYNNAAYLRPLVLVPVEVGVTWITSPSFGMYVGLPLNVRARITSWGAHAASNVVVQLNTPDGLVIRSATLEGASCSVGEQALTCARASMAARTHAELSVDLEALRPGAYIAPVQVTADGDAETWNNVLDWSLNAMVGPDLSVQGSATTAIFGVPHTVPITVRSANGPSSQVRVELRAPPHVTFESASGCFLPTPSSAVCTYSVLFPDVEHVIELRLRANLILSFQISAEASTSTVDLNTANNTAAIAVTVQDPTGDASVQVSQSSVSAQVGQSFSFPPVTVRAVTAVEDARLALTLDPNLASVVSATMDGAACSTSQARIECLLGVVRADAQRVLNLTLRANAAGGFTSDVVLSARNDSNGGNDVARVSVSLSNPQAPPPPPPSGSGGGGGAGGGGGGGGALDLRSVLFFLLLALLLRGGRRARVSGHIESSSRDSDTGSGVSTGKAANSLTDRMPQLAV
jgi:hypothetical protein